MKGIFYKLKTLFGFILILPELKRLGYKNVTLFSLFTWHHGVGYCMADNKDEQRVFIKSCGVYDAANCEYESLKLIYDIAPELVPKPIGIIHKFSFSIVIIECLNTQSLTNRVISESVYKEFCKRLISALNSVDIVHRDINFDNIVLSDGQIKIIDFAWALTNENMDRDRFHIESLKTLGGEYKLDELSWQDSYSLTMMGKEMFGDDFYFDIETKVFSLDVSNNH